jgi:hypothetical protein
VRFSVPPAEKKLTVGGTEHVRGDGVSSFRPGTTQLKFKLPVKPELVAEKVPLALLPGVTVTGLLLNEKSGCGTKIAGLFVELDGALLASPG